MYFDFIPMERKHNYYVNHFGVLLDGVISSNSDIVSVVR